MACRVAWTGHGSVHLLIGRCENMEFWLIRYWHIARARLASAGWLCQRSCWEQVLMFKPIKKEEMNFSLYPLCAAYRFRRNDPFPWTGSASACPVSLASLAVDVAVVTLMVSWTWLFVSCRYHRLAGRLEGDNCRRRALLPCPRRAGLLPRAPSSRPAERYSRPWVRCRPCRRPA